MGGYHIEPVGNRFVVIDGDGERVDTYATEDAAKQKIALCEKEDAMWETAKSLVDIAIATLMQMHNVDREKKPARKQTQLIYDVTTTREGH